MGKKYEQVEFLPGSTIDEVVNELLSYREKGKLAVVKFNGVTLYSDTVTLDSAYREITGKTKAEFVESQRLVGIKKRDIAMLYGTKLEQDWYWLKKQAEKAERYEEALEYISKIKQPDGGYVSRLDVTVTKAKQTLEGK